MGALGVSVAQAWRSGELLLSLARRALVDWYTLLILASVAFALWLIGAVIGVLRAARRTPPAPAVPVQGAPAPEAARTPPTATNG